MALAKEMEIDEYFIFMDSDDRLEQLFGVLRTLHGQQRNFDMLELEQNISIACSIREYFCRYPQKALGSRKLSQSLDHWNPKSWTGCTKTSTVDVADCWTRGAAAASRILRRGYLFSAAEVDWAAIALEPGQSRTLLKPNGYLVGVLR